MAERGTGAGPSNVLYVEYIVLLEDDEAHAELIRRAFEDAVVPARIEHVYTLAEARAALERGTPDLVLTDFKLPDGRGVDLLPPDASAVDVPLILMTSHGDEQLAVEAMKRGARDYVVKSDESLASMPRIAERVVREWRNLAGRKRAQAELRRSEARLAAAQRVAHVGCWEYQLDHRTWWLSDEALRILGLGSEIVPTSESLLERVIPGDRSRVRAVTTLACVSGAPFDEICRVQRPDGTLRVVQLACEPDGGRRILGTVQDVTDRKRLEEEFLQSKKNEAVGRLASGIAHDFNNLLMGIAGAIDVARKHVPARGPAREILDEVKRSTRGGAAITRQLLGFAGKNDGRSGGVAVDELVDGMRAMLSRLLGERVALRVEPGAGNLRVRLGPGRFQQVLMNLVVNARDAMPDGGTILVSTASVQVTEERGSLRRFAAGEYVTLAVSDTGCGMDEDTRARVFDPFFTTKEIGAGTGLGLSTIRTIVDEAGGRIDLETEIDVGTTFRIWLPVDGEAAPEEPEPPATEIDGTGRRVILVEDEEMVRVAVGNYLESAGFTVCRAADGEEALAALRRHRGEMDLVVTDVVLPGTSGAEVARTARELQPGLPVLCMSAYSADMLAAEQSIPESTPTLQKPFTREQLLARIAALLEDVPVRAAPAAPDAETAAATARGSGAGPVTVLLVEDEKLARMATSELLADEGFTVLDAASGNEALEAVAAHGGRIDAVIADLGLPDTSGPELVARVLRSHPDAGVIYVSGRSRGDPDIDALVRGGADYFEKPVDIDEIARLIERRVGGAADDRGVAI